MERFLSKVAHKADIPAEIVAGATKLEVVGTDELYVQNHKGLLDFSPTAVVICCGDITIRILGRSFVICAMTAKELRIKGVLQEIHYEN